MFNPSPNLTNIPDWENKAIAHLKQHTKATASEISNGINLPLMDTFTILNRLATSKRIEVAPDGERWQLTADERIKNRKRGDHADNS